MKAKPCQVRVLSGVPGQGWRMAVTAASALAGLACLRRNQCSQCEHLKGQRQQEKRMSQRDTKGPDQISLWSWWPWLLLWAREGHLQRSELRCATTPSFELVQDKLGDSPPGPNSSSPESAVGLQDSRGAAGGSTAQLKWNVCILHILWFSSKLTSSHVLRSQETAGGRSEAT